MKLADYQSLTRAAIDLHLTQPSLTRHLRHLEDHFGLELFARHGRGIVLTDAGRILLGRGEQLIEQLDGLRSELESSMSAPRGALSVGMPISWSELITYPVVERFRAEHPGVRIKLVVNSSEALATSMANSEVQFAVLTEIDDLSSFLARPFVEDSLFLVGPEGSGVSELGLVTLEDLVAYPMILPLNSTVGLRRIDRELAHMGLALDVVLETASTNILPLVRRGAGYTALSAAALPSIEVGAGLSAIQISGMTTTWAIATPKDRPKTSAVKVFETFVIEQVSRVVGAGRWRTAQVLLQPAAKITA